MFRFVSRFKNLILFYIGLLSQIPLFFVYLLSGLVPHSEKIWLFGCWEGQKFRGNSRYYYLYVSKKHPEIKAIWVTKNKALRDKLRASGYCSALFWEFGYLFTFLRSKIAFVTHGYADLNPYLTLRQIIINLGHSTFPVKDMRIKLTNNYLKNFIIKCRYPFGYLFSKPSYAITSSFNTLPMTIHHYGLPCSKVLTTGLPKREFLENLNDKIFYLNENEFAESQSLIEKFKIKENKYILFLPTWRNSFQFNFASEQFEFDGSKLDQWLDSKNLDLCINFHPAMRNKDYSGFYNLKRVRLLNAGDDEINQLLKKSKMLITDYSAIFADYLIFNKPIFFAHFDYEDYKLEKGIVLESETLPGGIAKNWPDLLLQLEKYENGIDEFCEKRSAMKEEIFPSNQKNILNDLFKISLETIGANHE